MEEQKRRRERKSAAYWLSKSSILYNVINLKAEDIYSEMD